MAEQRAELPLEKQLRKEIQDAFDQLKLDTLRMAIRAIHITIKETKGRADGARVQHIVREMTE